MSINPPTGKKYVRNGALAQKFDVSAMCIWRWKRDPELGCPTTYEVNGIEWNDPDEWDQWMRSRAVNYLLKEKTKPSRTERFHKTKKAAR
jgi:hypothetical protein